MSIETKKFEGMDKKERKAALKKEAEKQGISYDEMKKKYKESSSGKRKKSTEAESLTSDEQKKDIKRMRSYSKDFDGEKNGNEQTSKRRRTRSMDEKEEAEAKTKAEKSLTPEEWRKEQTITLKDTANTAV